MRGCVARHAARAVSRPNYASFSASPRRTGPSDVVNVLDCSQPEAATLDFGSTSATAGIASLAFARAAIKAALAGDVDAVVAAPQNETSIAQRRYRVRRLSVVRGARDRHRSGRRLPDAVLRRDQDRARHAPSQRARRAGAGHARERRCARSVRRIARSSGSASWRPQSRSAVSIRMPAKAACSAARRSRSSARRSPTLRRKASR